MKYDKRRWTAAYTALVLLLAAGCSTGLGDSPEGGTDAVPAGKGVVRVSLGTGGRTVIPDPTQLHYTLEFSRNGETVSAEIPIGEDSAECSLLPGAWNLAVKGYGSSAEAENGGTVLAGGNTVVTVESGEVVTAMVSLEILPDGTGNGALNYAITFPGTVQSAALALRPLTGSGTYREFNLMNTAVGNAGALRTSGTLDGIVPGYYRVTIQASWYDAARKIRMNSGRSRAAHIYGTLETDLTEEFAAGDFSEQAAFTSLDDMAAWLGAQEENGPDNPYYVALRDMAVEDMSSDTGISLAKLYLALEGRFVALDMGDCTGTGIPDITAGTDITADSLADSRGNTGIVSVILPKSLERIGARAFRNTRVLRSVILPAGLTSIGQGAFYNCKWLEAVEWPRSGPDAVIEGNAFEDCDILKSVSLPQSLKTISSYAFRSCDALEELRWPEGAEGASISHQAFSFCRRLKTVTLPDTLVSISDYAFSSCESLAAITLPRDLVALEMEAFSGCSALTTVDMSRAAGLKIIGRYAFQSCSRLSDLRFPPALETISQDAFYGCRALTELEFPATLREIHSRGFSGCSALKKIKLPGAFSFLGADAFSGCSSLEEADISSSVLGFDSSSTDIFKSCGALKQVKLPSQTSMIPDYMFSGCSSLETVELPSTVEYIGDYAFQNCTSLHLVKIAAESGSVTISSTAFSGCTGVKVEYQAP
jgi:hypothetical protein